MTQIVGPTRPASPQIGDVWKHTLSGLTFEFQRTASGAAWVQILVPGAPSRPVAQAPSITNPTPKSTTSPLAPTVATPGDFWFHSETGVEFVYYDDGDTRQWVTCQPTKVGDIIVVTGPAGGDLSGSYPNPVIREDVELVRPTTSIEPAPDANTLELAPTSWVNDAIIAAMLGDVEWDNIQNKPATFPPSPHTHPQSDIINLTTDLAGKVAKAGDTMTGPLNGTVGSFSTSVAGGGATLTGNQILGAAGNFSIRPGTSGIVNVLNNSGVNRYAFGSSDIGLWNGAALRWSSTAVPTDAADLSLSRAAAGVLSMLSGSVGAQIDIATDNTFKVQTRAGVNLGWFDSSGVVFARYFAAQSNGYVGFSTSAIVGGGSVDLALSRLAMGQLVISNNQGTPAGVMLDVATDATLKVRNRGNTAYGDIQAGSAVFNAVGGRVIQAGSDGNFTIPADRLLLWAGLTGLAAPSDAAVTIRNNANTAGVRLDAATDATLKLRNRADSADADINAASITLTTPGAAVVTSGDIRVGQNSTLYYQNRMGFTSPADGKWLARMNSILAGVLFDFTTDGLLKLRNRADGADAGVTLLAPSVGDSSNRAVTSAWVAATLAAGASIVVGTSPPGSPTANMLWWHSELGQLFIYYNDGNTTQWVPASPSAVSTGFRLLKRIVPTAGQTNLDFSGADLPSDINDLMFTADVTPQTNGAILYLRYFDNTGTIDATSGHYAWSHARSGNNSTTVNGDNNTGSGGSVGISLSQTAATARVGNTTGIRSKGHIVNIKEAGRLKTCAYQSNHTSDDGTADFALDGSGYRIAGAITGFRLAWHTGNFAAGGALSVWGSP